MNERESMLSDVNYTKIRLEDRINQASTDGYKNINSGGQLRFIELKQDDDAAILTTEEIRVQAGTLNQVQYRQAAGDGVWAIDLQQTGMKVKDMILMKGFTGQAPVGGIIPDFRATITALTANIITIDRALPAAINALINK